MEKFAQFAAIVLAFIVVTDLFFFIKKDEAYRRLRTDYDQLAIKKDSQEREITGLNAENLVLRMDNILIEAELIDSILKSTDRSTGAEGKTMGIAIKTFQVADKDDISSVTCDTANPVTCYRRVYDRSGDIFWFNLSGKYGSANQRTFDNLSKGDWCTARIIPVIPSDFNHDFVVVSGCR